MKTNQNSCSFLLCFFFLFFCFHLVWIVNTGANEDSEQLFSLAVKNESLESCLEKISELSGYQIFVAGEAVDHKISVNLENVTLEKSLARILKGTNHAMEWETLNRKVTLFLYGSKKAGYGTKKITGASPLSRFKTDVKEAGSESNSYGGSGNTESNRDYSRKSNGNLKISGEKTTFVQGSPTGGFDP